MLDAFEQGYLAEAALTWETIEKRDETIKSVAPKRKKAVARHGWEVIVLPNLPCDAQAEALRHKTALEYFYTNLTCANALDANERGGFKLLIRQMMDAVGKRYAIHEIVWKLEEGGVTTSLPARPVPRRSPLLPGEGQGEGSHVVPALAGSPPNSVLSPQSSQLPEFRLSAEFRFVPLWFFENTTGALRFLKNPYSLTGEPLQPGAWMITVSEGLMTACSVAWMYKHLPLQDWLDFSQKYAHPALLASTTAERNSTEWNYLEQVLEDFLSNLSAVTSASESIKLLDLKGGGELPYERLISRMDRLITALWRGADLSTLSREQGYGASLQSGESDILEQDDAELISETLQTSVDRYVIEYLFGKGVRPLAAIKILVTPRQSTPQDLQIDQFLIDHGARLAINDTLARYGRAEANTGEPYLQKPGRATLSQRADDEGRTATPAAHHSTHVVPALAGPESAPSSSLPPLPYVQNSVHSPQSSELSVPAAVQPPTFEFYENRKNDPSHNHDAAKRNQRNHQP